MVRLNLVRSKEPLEMLVFTVVFKNCFAIDLLSSKNGLKPECFAGKDSDKNSLGADSNQLKMDNSDSCYVSTIGHPI